jgi:rare lipoprotein A
MTFLKAAFACTAIAAPILAASLNTANAAQCGTASWYELTSKTANGERANPNGLTAAHPSLPFGSVVVVTNERNGRTVKVRINDRGPFTGGRIIDVTRAAALQLGFKNAGTARVCVSGGGQVSSASDTVTTRVSDTRASRFTVTRVSTGNRGQLSNELR